jgi:UDP-N-acetylmuramate dehydrogenase
MKQQLITRLIDLIDGDVLVAEPLSSHTTYRVGGEAEYLVCPHNSDEAAAVYTFVRRHGIPLTILGWGSNVIAPDDGIEGIVLKMLSDTAEIRFAGREQVLVDAGVNLIDLSRAAAAQGLGGFEPVAGIPGTVGGALFMNAGTKEGDIASLVDRVEVLTRMGRRRVFERRELAFGYRKSVFQESEWLILRVRLRLRPGDPAAIRDGIERILDERRRKFPLEGLSAGSVFKRPPGDYAGRLIEAAGCKGLRIGGAVVSERHANFIVNEDDATAADILALISTIRDRVYRKFGVFLELEQIPLPSVKWDA